MKQVKLYNRDKLATEQQLLYLISLCEKADHPFDQSWITELTRSEASQLITMLSQ